MNQVTQTLSELGLIFWDPEKTEWVTREEYLSGDVVGKLVDARATGLEPNIKALEEVQPLLVLPDAPVQTKLAVLEALGVEPGSLTKERLEAMFAPARPWRMDNILYVRLGSGWIPAAVYEQFGKEILKCRYLTITYAANTWRVDGTAHTHENLREDRTGSARTDPQPERATNLRHRG